MKEFTDLLERGLATTYPQLIVDRQGKPVGYELLGRGMHPDLPEDPAVLFTLAHSLNQEVQLSELFRRRAIAESHAANLQGLLFINTHPKECQDIRHLLREFQHLRECCPELSLVCEIHEAAVTDLKHMAEVRSGLQELGIRFAYDDFGAGQARLLALVKEPPDILKFDYSLISGLTSPAASTYQLYSHENVPCDPSAYPPHTSHCDHHHDTWSFSECIVDNTPKKFMICSYLYVVKEEEIMFRLARFLVQRLLFFIDQLVQCIQVLRRLGYVLLLIVSSFLVQLHICLYIGDHFGVLELASENGFYPLYDWSKHAERFLICCGAFLWLVYILPNRKGISPWAQGVWAARPPLLVALFHFGCWMVIWGPLANVYALYEGMSSLGTLACVLVLAELYYVQVWQDIVSQIRQKQKTQAENRRFVSTRHV